MTSQLVYAGITIAGALVIIASHFLPDPPTGFRARPLVGFAAYLGFVACWAAGLLP